MTTVRLNGKFFNYSMDEAGDEQYTYSAPKSLGRKAGRR